MPGTNILFVVCHPDDEALWAGGLIHGLSQLPGVCVHVICLSGRDESSPRSVEFEAARQVAGYRSGVVMGLPLRPASQPLPPVGATVEAGLERLGLSVTDIDVVITHSPFGEEHMHPHHMQACVELYAWASDHNVPFGYFSCLPLPSSLLQPLLRNMKRHGTMQLLNYARCRYGLLRQAVRWYERKPWRYPYAYMQWLVDARVRQAMLNCYQSIGLALHEQEYAMFNSNVEAIYLFDRRGAGIFETFMALMDVPGSPDFFPGLWTEQGIMDRLAQKFIRRSI